MISRVAPAFGKALFFVWMRAGNLSGISDIWNKIATGQIYIYCDRW